MNEIATLNPSDVLDKTAKFFRVMEKAGVDWGCYQLPIDNKAARRNLAEYLNAGCPKIKDGQATVMPANDYDLARTILGQDFIAPGEIAEARKITYGDDVLQHLAETLPSEEMLQWLRDNDFALMAGTPTPMSLLEIRDLNSKLFYAKSGGWYAESNQRFSRNDKVTTQWLMLRKSIVPKSTSKTWDEQQKLLSEVEYVPNVPEICWGITTYKEVRNVPSIVPKSTSKTWDEQQKLLSEVEYVPNVPEICWGITTYKEVRNVPLLPDIYARTSSVRSDGDHVSVGHSADGGIYVGGWDGDRNGVLGLAAARKRN